MLAGWGPRPLATAGGTDADHRDFCRATHLSVKMLRHYHEIGLLEPAGVDPGTGYRRYSTGQIATAQVIRRFRDLDMPLDQIQAVLAAPDSQARSRPICAHLARRPPGQSGIATPAPSRPRRSVRTPTRSG
jgi:DNA-binding transcriptional MerR regulator